MGFGLTFEKMLQHFVSEPDMILSSIMLSLKDIIEILYFYFTELSLTACYVILFILAARYLLRNAPKIYSYSLWGIVYFKLVAVLKFDFWKHSFIPQAQIDKVYQNITPDYTAFYSTESGVVSIVQSEMVTPPSITPVTPMYIPAFIWFIGVMILLCLSFGAFVHILSQTTGTKQKLYDNIYVCRYITSPFIFSIIRPKIYLPEGLTEQEQHYVITHEKVHIKRGDHIVKLFAFFITVMHWFNPLVWLSFFLLEKDMEMSCDEKVISILGKEHKQEYSRCILSLATSKRFVPKAYLSFGDSDTKKRVKNVLNYKKPAVIASVMIIIGIIVIAAGMLSENRYNVPPHNSAENQFAAMEENFPEGDDRFHFTFSGLQTSVNFNLPNGWYLEKRDIQIDERPEYLTIDDNFSDVWDIYNTDRENIGAMGFVSYTEYLGAENNLMAIYGPVSLMNMYHFDLSEENYFAVSCDQNGLWETATTKVYHSPQLNRDLGLKAETTYGDGILSYDRECLAFVAFEFREDYFSEKELNYIATSIEISPQNSFNSIAAAVLSMQYRNMETGTDFDITEYVNKDVLALLEAKEEIAKHRIRIFGTDKQSYTVQVIPYDTENWVQNTYHAEIKMQVLRTYRYVSSNSDTTSSDIISLTLEAGTLGKIIVTDYRIDGKDTTFADMDKDYWQAVAEGKGQKFLDEFVREYKNFVSDLRSGLPSKTEISEFVKNNDDADILYSFAQWYGFTLKDLQTLYKNNSWRLVTTSLPDINTDRTGIVLQMLIDGRTTTEIRDYIKEDITSLGISDDDLRSFTQKSFHPIEVYCMTDEKINEYLTNWRTPQPRLLSYENLAAEMVEKYKNSEIEYNSSFGRLPSDFVFPEVIMWDSITIYQNEMGYYVVPIASATGDNIMYVAINDSKYLSGETKNFDLVPVVQSVSFKKPSVNLWYLSVDCAEKSSFNKYVITYCDEQIGSETGRLYLTNTNNFDITVHLINSGNEITTDLPANLTAEILVEAGENYTVGIHAAVAENTKINLTVFEAY